MNLEISNYLNSFLDNKIIADIVFLFADLPIFIVPLFFVIMWIIFAVKKDDKNKTNLLFIFYGIVVCILINVTIQHFYFVDRPMISLQNAGRLLLEHIPNASFPSDHAGVSISFLAGLFFFGFRKYFYIFLPFFVIMNLSRIAGGIHWTTDILAGAVIGTISEFFIFKIRNFNIMNKINNFLLKIASFLKL